MNKYIQLSWSGFHYNYCGFGYPLARLLKTVCYNGNRATSFFMVKFFFFYLFYTDKPSSEIDLGVFFLPPKWSVGGTVWQAVNQRFQLTWCQPFASCVVAAHCEDMWTRGHSSFKPHTPQSPKNVSWGQVVKCTRTWTYANIYIFQLHNCVTSIYLHFRANRTEEKQCRTTNASSLCPAQ